MMVRLQADITRIVIIVSLLLAMGYSLKESHHGLPDPPTSPRGKLLSYSQNQPGPQKRKPHICFIRVFKLNEVSQLDVQVLVS